MKGNKKLQTKKTMQRTRNQNRQLHLLMGANGIDADTKKEMVYNYTDGRTTKSSEMHRMECQALINQLRQSNPTEVKSDKMRKKIISLFIKQGYTLQNGKPDMLAIESWSERYGYLKKPFNSYKYAELPQLVTQADNMYKTYINSL